MRFAYLSREVGGWALILIGFFIFFQAYGFLLDRRIFEATPLVFMGFIVFRGGIHVLKVAVAAQAARNLPESAAPTRRLVRARVRSVGPTPPRSVLPGPGTSTPIPANPKT
jgi:membrane-bound ClpP family serine protease